MDTRTRSAGVDPPSEAGSLRERLYRYFFYGWLFRDADCGTPLERAAALRHNVRQARWLPTYLLRWAIVGASLAALQFASERLAASPALGAAFAVLLVLVILFELVTAICWAFLKVDRHPP